MIKFKLNLFQIPIEIERMERKKGKKMRGKTTETDLFEEWETEKRIEVVCLHSVVKWTLEMGSYEIWDSFIIEIQTILKMEHEMWCSSRKWSASYRQTSGVFLCKQIEWITI